MFEHDSIIGMFPDRNPGLHNGVELAQEQDDEAFALDLSYDPLFGSMGASSDWLSGMSPPFNSIP
jgi:hypothetical protein